MKKNKILFHKMLCLLLGLLGLVQFSSAQQKDSTADDGTIRPLVHVINEDYMQARATFKTKLLKQNHAPSRIDSIGPVPDSVSQIEFFSGSLKLKAWVNLPLGKTKKYPVVVFIHGGYAFEKEDWDMAKPFRDAGFIVITPILRAEDGQGGIFSMFYDEVDDVIALTEYLRKQSYIDKKKIFIAGHSTGGTIALLAAMSTTAFKKAASFSGSPDQAIYCKYGINPKFIPFDTTNIKEYEVRSPLSYAGSFKCPVRLYYGERERHWRLSTQQTVAEAKKKGLDVESFEVDGGHENAVSVEMQQAILFFKEK